MARTMKRKSRTNKKFGKQNGKCGSKKVYKKRTSKRLRKTAKRVRRGSRKMRGGADLSDIDQSTILSDGESHYLDTSLSLDETTGEGHTTSETGTGTTNSFSNVASNLQGNSSNISNISAISNATSAGTMTVGELDLSNASSASGVTDGSKMSTSFPGGKRIKGKKIQKRRRGKKGGELPFDYNPNDRDPDADHD